MHYYILCIIIYTCIYFFYSNLSFIESTNELVAKTEFPGLPVWYSENDGRTWLQYKRGVMLSNNVVCQGSGVKLVTK